MTFPLPNVSNDLNGRVALVTGASSGFGVRFAKALAACGAKVGLAARRVDRLEAVAEEIRAAGGEAICIPMDATDADQLFAAVDCSKRPMERSISSSTMQAFRMPSARTRWRSN